MLFLFKEDNLRLLVQPPQPIIKIRAMPIPPYLLLYIQCMVLLSRPQTEIIASAVNLRYNQYSNKGLKGVFP